MKFLLPLLSTPAEDSLVLPTKVEYTDDGMMILKILLSKNHDATTKKCTTMDDIFKNSCNGCLQRLASSLVLTSLSDLSFDVFAVVNDDLSGLSSPSGVMFAILLEVEGKVANTNAIPSKDGMTTNSKIINDQNTTL
mmetsp:Transcript_25228/g.53200  ORF Transcript_25228/g.53200 Transcript_25228/m.53200 type:complete len:137 (+) Transcript_25228:1526-1936(+)